MTVIAAALTKSGVIMAADAQISAGWQKQAHDLPKLWLSDQFAMGGAGSMRTCQILKHHATWPKYRPDENGGDLEKFAVVSLVPAIRQAAKEHGALYTHEGIEHVRTTLLLTIHDQLMEISGDGAVVIDPSGRMAIGSGYAEALGTLGDVGPWTERDVIAAAYRATLTAHGCGGPITVLNARKRTIKTVEVS